MLNLIRNLTYITRYENTVKALNKPASINIQAEKKRKAL
jgi:hypothetical protein